MDSVRQLLPQAGNAELIIVDQTPGHEAETSDALERWSMEGSIRWIRLDAPSVTGAMNRGLVEARAPLVLFLDDDIEPAPDLLLQHVAAHRESDAALLAGRVIQPWERGQPATPASLFNACEPGPREEFMGGNFSIRREVALDIGGFDENFRFAAYRYEREFADRLLAAGRKILYTPDAWIYHLQAERGGVRSYGNHLTTARPGHSLGAYYYILGAGEHRIRRITRRMGRAVSTRYHLRNPWHMPRTLWAELRGLTLAAAMWRRGRSLLSNDVRAQAVVDD